MPAITFEKWTGIDRRKGRSVTSSDKLWVLENAFINTGNTPQKRPGLTKIATVSPLAIGMFSGKGRLNIFHSKSSDIVTSLTVSSNITLTNGSTLEKTGGVNGTFDGQAYTTFSITGRSQITFTMDASPTDQFAVGFNLNPAPSAHYTSMDFSVRNANTEYRFYKGATLKFTHAVTTALDDKIRLEYDGISEIAFYLNGTLLHTEPSVGAGKIFFMDTSFRDTGAKLKVLSFLGGNVIDYFRVTPIASTGLKEVHFVDVFQQFMYVIITDLNDIIQHHYVDGSGDTRVTDSNNPQSIAAIKTAEKIFATGDEVVRYSATADPRDWTTASDAGFIATGIQAPGNEQSFAFGIYSGQMAIFSNDAVQLWTVDPDPANFAIGQIVSNVGSRYNRAVVNVSGDLYFLSDFGIRAIATQAYTALLYDVDIGAHVDELVKEELEAFTGEPHALFFQGGKQYLLALGQTVFVYTFSRVSRVSAWSKYTYAFNIDYMAELNGELYFRAGDDVYLVDKEAFTDDGTQFTVIVETAFDDFKKSGQLKHAVGFDIVMTGTASVEVLYDANNEASITLPLTLSGDTRSSGTIPIELDGTEFATRIVNQDANAWQLDMVAYYYSILGIV